ncbi:MAG: hypothetical protein E6K75_00170 [Candidatus Eisenbacteria bacterium]|uniref:Peptidylprolyl isomerase n=1 Tax=Eiseniibacteriota bacterium TaxID=2212470 RepID=A0A538TF25_UNCEI|nr:MAG: hypothetical protein E6K75_00170 [Candidatus Eisenbacteria bacterium]
MTIPRFSRRPRGAAPVSYALDRGLNIMMQSMRDNMKVIIWATAIVFLVGFGVLQLGGVLNPPSGRGGPAGVIARINGEPVRYEEFNGMYQNILNSVRQSREIKEGEDSYIREQAWSDMVTSKLVQQEVRRRGITVTYRK